LFSLVLAVVACDDPSEPASEVFTPVPTPGTDAAAIRAIDVTQLPEVRSTLTRLSGASVAEGEVQYGDVTSDGREEAIVPVSSGGTLGNISYLVFSEKGGAAQLILTRDLEPDSIGGLTMYVEDGVLVEYTGEYGPEDPLCCPTVLRRATFRWDGSKLQQASEERIPAGQQKE
jgi:hypothetical protein